MQSSERTEFEEQLGILCAGFNVPVTPHRREAYWKGLAKMSLAQFARCVDHAVSDDWADAEVPTTKQIWGMHRSFRMRPAGVIATQDHEREDPRDHLLFYANRMFLRHLVTRGGLGSTGRFVPAYGMVDCKPSPELIVARKFVRDLVDWWCGPIAEGDPDAIQADFIRQFMTGLDKISPLVPEVKREWESRIADPRSQAPFDRSMGRRPLEAQYEKPMTVGAQAALELVDG